MLAIRCNTAHITYLARGQYWITSAIFAVFARISFILSLQLQFNLSRTCQRPARLAMIWIPLLTQRALREENGYLKTEMRTQLPAPGIIGMPPSHNHSGTHSQKFSPSEQSLVRHLQSLPPAAAILRSLWSSLLCLNSFTWKHKVQHIARWFPIFRVPGVFHLCNFKTAQLFLQGEKQ